MKMVGFIQTDHGVFPNFDLPLEIFSLFPHTDGEEASELEKPMADLAAYQEFPSAESDVLEAGRHLYGSVFCQFTVLPSEDHEMSL